MRKILIIFAVFAGLGLAGPTANEAQASCTHFGSQGACPVNIQDGSTSTTVNADGTLYWYSGGVSGPCCAAPGGTETGAGLLNLNNELDTSPGNDPSNSIEPGGTAPTQAAFEVEVDPATGRLLVVGRGWSADNCLGYQCQGGSGATLFGSGPNGGYLCDSGGPGCGDDLWNTFPQPGFGECGPGGCGGPTVVLPINPTGFPVGPYAQNSTLGNIDPFGGGSDVFLDPDTGAAITIDGDRRKWPERIQHAADLNAAYINGEIAFYPFGDPNWATKSVEDFRNSTPPPLTNEQAGIRFDAPQVFVTEDRRMTGVSPLPLNGIVFDGGPYARNATTGNFDPFGGGGSFTDPRTGESTSLPDDQSQWPDKFKKAMELNDAYVNGRISYPFNDPDWENKSADDFKTPAGSPNFGTGIVSAPSTPLTGISFGDGTSQPDTPADPPGGTARRTGFGGKAGRFGIGADPTLTNLGGLPPTNVAKNFGIQGIVSYARVDFEPKEDNSDLTGYVGNVLVAISGSGFTQPGQTVPFTGPSGVPTTVIAPGNETNVVNRTNLRTSDGRPVTLLPAPETGPGTPTATRPPAPRIRQISERGNPTNPVVSSRELNGETTFTVSSPTAGKFVTFTSRRDAFRFFRVARDSGMSWDAALASLPADERPIPVAAPGGTDAVDTLIGNVPAEFRRAFVTDRMDGEIRDIYVNNPQTGERQRFSTTAGAQAMIDALDSGQPWAEARTTGRTFERQASDAPVNPPGANTTAGSAADTTAASNIGDSITGNVPSEFRAPFVTETESKDGSKSITVTLPRGRSGKVAKLGFAYREGADAMVEALRAGKTPIEAYNAGRKADSKIRREERNRRESEEDTGITTTRSGLASASSPGARTPAVPRPTRPEGDSVDFMEQAGFKGSIYRLEIIRTPDGRTLAVGTGDHAGHVFGETKKGFLGWRREGPWTPPPAPAPFIGNERPAIIVNSEPAANNGGQVVTSLPGKIEPGDKIKVLEIGRGPGAGANDNFQIRIQIANSDRDQMTQPGKITFEPGDASGFSSTNR